MNNRVVAVFFHANSKYHAGKPLYKENRSLGSEQFLTMNVFEWIQIVSTLSTCFAYKSILNNQKFEILLFC